MNWDGLNRRRFPRVNYPCLITVRQNKGGPDVILTHTENIGVGGVCVILNRQVTLYTPVELEIDLLDTSGHLKCQGKVVWAIQRKESERKKPLFYDIGIEFAAIEENDQRRLDEIVNRLLKLGHESVWK